MKERTNPERPDVSRVNRPEDPELGGDSDLRRGDRVLRISSITARQTTKQSNSFTALLDISMLTERLTKNFARLMKIDARGLVKVTLKTEGRALRNECYCKLEEKNIF